MSYPGSGRPVSGDDAARPGYRSGETLTWLIAGDVNIHVGSRSENLMSKGTDRKKETKKKPAKTLKQKQADKKSKKATQRIHPLIRFSSRSCDHRERDATRQ